VAYLQWEKKRIPFKIEVPNVNTLDVAKMRQDLQPWAGFNFQDWQTAAQFCADNKINLEEAPELDRLGDHGPFRRHHRARGLLYAFNQSRRVGPDGPRI